MKRFPTKTISAILLLVGATIGVRTYLASQKDEQFRVNTVQVTRGLIADEVSATGSLQAINTVQVGAQISGTVSWLGADFNSIVRRGQVIARLDSLSLESQVAQVRASLTRATAEAENARIQLANARRKHERMLALWTQELISQNEFDAAMLAVALGEAQEKSAEAQVTQAAAALHQSEVALSHSVITAPIDGIVIQRSVDVGQTVSASQSAPTIFAIAADLAQMQVNAGVDESDIAKIRPLQNVRFQVDAHPGESFDGTVTQVRLEPTVAQNVITYSAIIAVHNPELKLRPGMTANVKIQVMSRNDAVRVPNAALRFRPTAAIYAALGQTPPAGSGGVRQRAGSENPASALALIDDEEGDAGRSTFSIGERNPGATTVDALFAPLNPVESEGGVWVYANEQLALVPVRLGITDGQTTELLEGDLQPDMELVTNVITGQVRTTTPAAASTGGIFMNTPGGGSGRQGGAGTRSPRG